MVARVYTTSWVVQVLCWLLHGLGHPEREMVSDDVDLVGRNFYRGVKLGLINKMQSVIDSMKATMNSRMKEWNNDHK